MKLIGKYLMVAQIGWNWHLIKFSEFFKFVSNRNLFIVAKSTRTIFMYFTIISHCWYCCLSHWMLKKRYFYWNKSFLNFFKINFLKSLLTYLAIKTCYRSWPQLICDAIHHALLQFGANFWYVVKFSSNCLAQRWRGRSFVQLAPFGSDSKTLRTGLQQYTNVNIKWYSYALLIEGILVLSIPV